MPPIPNSTIRCVPFTIEIADEQSAHAFDHARLKRAVRGVLQAAGIHSAEISIAIVDDGGHLIYFQRIDGTQTGSVLVSQRKAQTAIGFKRPSKVFEEGVAGGRNALLGLPGAVPLEGGLPLSVDGQMIGAIGVSGVTAQQDGMIAQAGIDALPEILKGK